MKHNSMVILKNKVLIVLALLLIMVKTSLFAAQSREGKLASLNGPGKAWRTDTVNHYNGTREVIQKRTVGRHFIRRSLISRRVRLIKYYDQCGTMVRKMKIMEYHGCFGVRERTIFDKKYRSTCEQ